MSDTTQDRLAQIAQRVEAATEGPWFEDTAFATHARTDIPAMHAALTAVLALHRVRPWHAGDGVHFGQTTFPDLCKHCGTEHPCQTTQAINDALGGE
jgi:hypothetical protein